MTRRSSSSRWLPNWPGCIRRPCAPTTGWAWSRRGVRAKRGRRYSARDIARLRLIQRLSQDEGINLEGIRRILHMQDDIDELRARVEQLTSLLGHLQSRARDHESSPLIRSAACISGGVGGDHRWLFLAALCRRQTPIR